MATRKNKFIACTLLFLLYQCCFAWFISEGMNIVPDKMASLSIFTSPYAGYNARIIHGTIDMSLYCGGLLLLLDNPSSQFLTRRSRNQFLFSLMVRLTFPAMLFSAAVCTVLSAGVLLYGFSISFLNANMYFFCLLIEFLGLFLTFLSCGLLFLAGYVITLKKHWAFFAASIMAVFITITSAIFHYWTPLATIEIFEEMETGNGLDLLSCVQNIALSVTVIVTLFFVLRLSFRDRDII